MKSDQINNVNQQSISCFNAHILFFCAYTVHSICQTKYVHCYRLTKHGTVWSNNHNILLVSHSVTYAIGHIPHIFILSICIICMDKCDKIRPNFLNAKNASILLYQYNKTKVGTIQIEPWPAEETVMFWPPR